DYYCYSSDSSGHHWVF
nr:immunoglobulin light chain junction region [Macaca mulatta]MOV94987.1 immunoglobulin light chain junction region [Macaca mulatta]MOV95039.1 immunoglobulin light chain junction region [Macaca mulatta]MOV95063.1 immunoglobulin light chain junction region [Macaca mulatta]MOV95179.1 immunoglobulin light chain junction region [Macaca mulatta]